jgi:hypothetical protein
MKGRLFVRLRAIRTIPSRRVVTTAVVSLAGLALASLQGMPLWAIALLALLPWVPILAFEVSWTTAITGGWPCSTCS